jgi:hypothetical protein
MPNPDLEHSAVCKLSDIYFKFAGKIQSRIKLLVNARLQTGWTVF